MPLRWCLLVGAVAALVLIPFWLFEARMAEAVDGILHAGANRPVTAGAVVLLLAADVLLPVPSSLVATASGMLLGLVPGMTATWVGMQSGALVGYGIGRSAGVFAAARFAGKAELARVSQSYQRWGGWFLVASRAVPVLAESSVVIAGVARLPLARFFWLTGVSNAGIAAAYAGVGSRARDANSFLLAFAASLFIPGALTLASRLLSGRPQDGLSVAAGRGPAEDSKSK